MNNFIKVLQRKVSRVQSLGPRKTCAVLYNRAVQVLNGLYWKHHALKGTAHHTWDVIARRHKFPNNFSSFFSEHKKNVQSNIVCKQYLQYIDYDVETIIKRADAYRNNCFDLLGSGPVTFKDQINWHGDFRLKESTQSDDVQFDAQAYYKDITSSSGTGGIILNKDIKIPWELSRFQHVMDLGLAYQETGDVQYAYAFVNHVTDWLDNNPYLFGPNWVCAMDVGLRSVSLVWGFYFFASVEDIDDAFWKRFVCSLYDHVVYLENNWEVYDGRTSNHYLSDLIGYLYLCLFFKNLKGFDKKYEWVCEEIFREFDKQIFDEGSDYEGSTAYHGLVIELFFHWYSAQNCFKKVNTKIHTKMQLMFEFSWWCTPYNGMLVTIGDNDSGKVMSWKPVKFFNTTASHSVKHYQQFGLSVIKTEAVHCTLRHHAYKPYQPSGHYHNDVGSITLAFNGISLFVDPGSYVYTPSVYWRNYFRSIRAHNAMFIKDHELIPFDDYLFGLNMPEHDQSEKVDTAMMLETSHSLYARFGVVAHRTVTVDSHEVSIVDWWKGEPNQNLTSSWNFTVSPDIVCELQANQVVFTHNGIMLATMHSDDVEFVVHDGWYSPAYGVKQACKRIYAEKQLDVDEVTTITIILIS